MKWRGREVPSGNGGETIEVQWKWRGVEVTRGMEMRGSRGEVRRGYQVEGGGREVPSGSGGKKNGLPSRSGGRSRRFLPSGVEGK